MSVDYCWIHIKFDNVAFYVNIFNNILVIHIRTEITILMKNNWNDSVKVLTSVDYFETFPGTNLIKLLGAYLGA